MGLLRTSSIYGKLLLLIGGLLAMPILVLLIYPTERHYFIAFFAPAVCTFLLGVAICIVSSKRVKKDEPDLLFSVQRGSMPVLFTWCFAFLVGAIPFLIGEKLTFPLALYESISGWTTTGFTAVDVTTMPRIFLFHRSLMQFCGGIGFIVMFALLAQGSYTMSLYDAEGHPDRLAPSLRKTAKVISTLYVAFLTVGSLLFWAFGMRPFDAITHAMSTVSTAGFTSQAHGIASFHSAPIEIVTIILMLIGSTNFAILFLLVRLRFKQVLKISEFRFLIYMLLLFVPLVTFSLVRDLGQPIPRGFLNALFGVATTLSTSGYGTMEYAAWPTFALLLLFPLMIIGGGIGSTTGGIKLQRIYILLVIMWENLKRRVVPSRNVRMLSYQKVQGRAPIDETLAKDTIGFVMMYGCVLFLGTLLLALTSGAGLFYAAFEFTSTLGNVGLSSGVISTDSLPTSALVVKMFGMVLGRLEIFIVFIGAYSWLYSIRLWFWRIKEKGKKRT